MPATMATHARGTWYQRKIVEFIERDKATGKLHHVKTPKTRAEQAAARRRPRDPSRVIEARKLRCGHTEPAKMARPGGSKSNSAPCSKCREEEDGRIIHRRQFERQRQNGWIVSAHRRAVAHPVKSAALADLYLIVRLILTYQPRDAELERLYERAIRAIHDAGMDQTPEDEASYG